MLVGDTDVSVLRRQAVVRAASRRDASLGDVVSVSQLAVDQNENSEQ